MHRDHGLARFDLQTLMKLVSILTAVMMPILDDLRESSGLSGVGDGVSADLRPQGSAQKAVHVKRSFDLRSCRCRHYRGPDTSRGPSGRGAVRLPCFQEMTCVSENAAISRELTLAMERDLDTILWVLKALGAPKDRFAHASAVFCCRTSCASWSWSITPMDSTTWTRFVSWFKGEWLSRTSNGASSSVARPTAPSR